METLRTGFENELKQGLVGTKQARFVYINNFEVEESWQDARMVRLPTVSLGSSKVVVHRMEELGLFLAGKNDFVVLKGNPDQAYIRYVQGNGFELPTIIVVEENDPKQNITENILNCKRTLKQLSSLATQEQVYLMPFGVSAKEELLSKLTGIPLAVPNSETFKKVNNKIFSRELNDKLGIKQIRGFNCSSIEELQMAFVQLRDVLQRNGKLVLKDALGVSGKGIVVIDSERKFERCLSMLQKGSRAGQKKALQYVLEEWIDKVSDLNYQLFISKEGTVTFQFVKEALVKNGVHQGHLMPSTLSKEQIEELQEVGGKLGRALYEAGYYGIVGIDAILDKEGLIWPNLEINARFNMSTYQCVIQERWLDAPTKLALATHYPLKLKQQLSFEFLYDLLRDDLFSPSKGSGFLITNFSTVNAAFVSEGQAFNGRLYGMIITDRMKKLEQMDERIRKALSKVEW